MPLPVLVYAPANNIRGYPASRHVGVEHTTKGIEDRRGKRWIMLGIYFMAKRPIFILRMVVLLIWMVLGSTEVVKYQTKLLNG